MTFAATLKQWRSRHKLSQSQAADALKVSKRTLQDWEQERRTPNALAQEAIKARMENAEGKEK